MKPVPDVEDEAFGEMTMQESVLSVKLVGGKNVWNNRRVCSIDWQQHL